MHGIAQAVTWAAFFAGVFLLTTGAVTLLRRDVAIPWLRSRREWKREGWAEVMFGLFVMVETVPRLVNDPADLVFVLSIAALAPLTGAMVLRMRTGPPQA